MATVNNVKTRILNKISTWSEWESVKDTFRPLRGEICIVEIPTNTDDTGLTPPAIGIKVGDGQRYFGALPWVQAIAGDVAAEIKTLTGVADIDAKIADLASGRQLATVAELNSFSESLRDTSAIVSSLSTKIGKVNIGKDDNDQEKSITQAIADLQSAVGDSSEGLGTQVSNLKEVVGDANSGLVKDVTDLKSADISMSSRVDGIEDRVEANEGKLAGINGTVVDSIAAVNTTANQALGNANTLIGSDAGKSVRTIANEELAAQLLSGKADADFKTLKDLANWLESHPEDAFAMNTAINSMKQNLGYTGEHLETAPATVDARIATAISNLETKINISNYVDKTTYQGTTDAVAGLNSKVDTGDKNVSVYVADALATYANSGALHDVSERVTAIENAPYASTGYVDNKVAALAGEGNTSTVKANADAIAALAGANNTSTVSANATNIASLQNTVKSLVENDTVEGIVSAVTQDTNTGKISIAHKKITMEDMAQKDPADTSKDYIFIFDCGNASRDA